MNFYNQYNQLVIPISIILSSLVFGLITKSIFLKYSSKWSKKTKWRFIDITISSIKGSYVLLIFMLGLFLALKFSNLEPKLDAILTKSIFILIVVYVAIITSNIINNIIHFHAYADKFGMALPITTISKNFSAIIIYIVGTLFILNILGISITPVLTALGVGGIAVALALQDTLSNLFAGLYISISKQIRLGDYIKLDTGQEGYVVDITWRSTEIHTITNSIIIIPNTKLAQSIVTNHYLPDKKMSILLPISVSYDSDPDHIEKVLLEEALLAQKEVDGMNRHTTPSIRFMPGFGSYSLDFTLVCHINEFRDHIAAQSELNKRILKRFKKEHIEIPYPVRMIINKKN